MPKKGIPAKTSAFPYLSLLLLAIILGGAGLLLKNYQIARQSYNLAFEVVSLDNQIINETNQDQVHIFSDQKSLKQALPNADLGALENFDFNSSIILGVISYAQPSSGYRLQLCKLSQQNSTVSLEYQLIKPSPDGVYLTVITYPNLFLSIALRDISGAAIEKRELPVGEIYFSFYNRSTRQKSIEIAKV